MLGVLFLLQTASTPSCAQPALCQLLERAAAANRRAGLATGGYRATVETETATLGLREGRMEAATLLEQSSGIARWGNDVGFDFHIVGSRAYLGAIPLSRLGLLRIAWIVPTLAGSRLGLITRSGTGKTDFSQTLTGALAPAVVVHPLTLDHERFYSFTGGTVARRRIELTEREVLVLEVIPRTDLTGQETLFEGELDLDPQSYGIVRMVGRFRVIGPGRRGGLLPDFEPEKTLVDLINQQLPNGSWVPLVQRFEIQSPSSHEKGSGGARRVISRFHQVEAIAGRAGEVEIGMSTMGYQVTRAPRDSLRRFRGWFTRAGAATEGVTTADFSRYQPDRDNPNGRPLFMLQGFHRRDFLRVNRIEGLFTGLAGMLRLRDAAPGGFLHGAGGYAWSEKTFRGTGGIGWESPQWSLYGRAARELDVTNEFRNQFDSRALAALLGRDAWDYVDRREAGAALTRSLDPQGGILKLEFARVEDAIASRHMEKSLFGRTMRPNRNIAPGTYWRSRATLDWNPEVSPLFAHDGVGFRAEVERGDGELDYTHLEGRVVLRKTLTRMFFIARLHGGALLSDAPPPQQLFELGGPAGMPGYEYKEFAGDRAALFRMRLTYPLTLANLPWRVSSRLTLPALAPAISLGFQAGYTDTRNAAGAAAVRALGDRYDYKTGELVSDSLTGDALPASVVTDKVKTSIDVRIGFFGDALAIGVARALEKGRKTRFIFAFGRQF
ncbi:MAG TPA: hypothetical protein VGQ69_09650 [Gemmatimonadales bacterium]|nr:hypothetical protein [Gemmatimonadales bacterium]